MKIKKAIIPAAGFGTRMLPATKSIPKEMLPIVDTPIIQLAVEEAIAAGIEDIIIVTGRGKSAIEDHFGKVHELEQSLEKNMKHETLVQVQKHHATSLYYVRQNEMKGLGDAIYQAHSFIHNEPFAIILPDDVILGNTPCLKQMVDSWGSHHIPMVASMQVALEDRNKYGMLEIEKETKQLLSVSGMIEKPAIEDAPSPYAIIGRYIVPSEIFGYIEKTPPGKNGEIQLTDALLHLCKDKGLYGFLFDGKRFDTGNPTGFIEANIFAGLQKDSIKASLRVFLDDLSF